MKANSRYFGPARIAHRGNVKRAPENTMEAIRAAHQRGFEGAEIDVRLTKDGKVVLSHDADLMRATSGGPDEGLDWKFRDRTWAEVEQAAFPYANHLMIEFPAEGISERQLNEDLVMRQLGRDPHHPHSEERLLDDRIAHPVLFEEVLGWIVAKDAPFLLEVECKEDGLPEALLEVFHRVGGADRCILFSGEEPTIGELVERLPPPARIGGLRIGANIRRLTPGWRRLLPDMRLDVVDVNAFEVDRSEVQWLLESGLQVLSNLGDLPAWWDTLEEWGFAGFKTNFPEAYTEWWQRRR